MTNSKHTAGLIGPTLIAFNLSAINFNGQDDRIVVSK